jgi:hypothetical protein
VVGVLLVVMVEMVLQQGKQVHQAEKRLILMVNQLLGLQVTQQECGGQYHDNF